MKTEHAVALIVAGVGVAYIYTKWQKMTPAQRAVILPPSMTPGASFVGPMPAASGVIGSKPAAAFVGPLPFMGPPAPDETVRVSTDYQEVPFGWPL